MKKKDIKVYATYTLLLTYLGSAFKVIFKANITNYKSRSEVYSDEFYILYYDLRYQIREWANFRPKRR